MKQFIIAWGAGYDHAHKTVGEEFFTNDNGFDDEDIENILEQTVGEAWRCADIGVVTVLRIEDKE